MEYHAFWVTGTVEKQKNKKRGMNDSKEVFQGTERETKNNFFLKKKGNISKILPSM